MPEKTIEERIARIEALLEMDDQAAEKLDKRFTKMEERLTEVIMELHGAKVTGRAFMGAAMVAGGFLTVIGGWAIDLLKGAKG